MNIVFLVPSSIISSMSFQGSFTRLINTSKMPAFTLYGARGSTNTDRVRLTLAEGGFTDYEFVLLDLAKGEQKVPILSSLLNYSTPNMSFSQRKALFVTHGAKSQPSHSPMASPSMSLAQSVPTSPTNTHSPSSLYQPILKLALFSIKHSL